MLLPGGHHTDSQNNPFVRHSSRDATKNAGSQVTPGSGLIRGFLMGCPVVLWHGLELLSEHSPWGRSVVGGCATLMPIPISCQIHTQLRLYLLPAMFWTHTVQSPSLVVFLGSWGQALHEGPSLCLPIPHTGPFLSPLSPRRRVGSVYRGLLLGNSSQQWILLCHHVHIIVGWPPFHNQLVPVHPHYTTSARTTQKTAPLLLHVNL
jgi:hypothetical protein